MLHDRAQADKRRVGHVDRLAVEELPPVIVRVVGDVEDWRPSKTIERSVNVAQFCG